MQGVSAKSDKFSNADVEYQIEGTSTWTKAGTLSDKGDQTISFGNVANVKAVRLFLFLFETPLQPPDNLPRAFRLIKPALLSVQRRL